MPFNPFNRNPFERESSRLPSYVYDPLDVVAVKPQGDVMRRGLDRSIQSEADAFQRVEELLASLSQGKAGDVLRPVIGLFERARQDRAILPEAYVTFPSPVYSQ